MASSLYDLDQSSVLHPPSPTLGGLAGTAGTSAQGAGQSALGSQLPGYMTSMSNIGTNIASETAGQVPDDVIEQLKQQGAEGKVSTGAASNAAYLHALGLTSLGLENQGQQNLESIEPSTPGYTVSQNPEFQTSANLQYEEQLQPQVFAMQQQQQNIGFAQQQAALNAAKAGLKTAAPGSVDALGQPNISTASLPGQTAATGYSNPWGGPLISPTSNPWSPTPAASVQPLNWPTGSVTLPEPGTTDLGNSNYPQGYTAWDFDPMNPSNAGMSSDEINQQLEYANAGGAAALDVQSYDSGGDYYGD